MTQEPTQADLARLIDREVYLCLSSIVSTLASGYGADITSRRIGHGENGPTDLINLAEQAYELARPVEDYEEAAIQAGWHIRHDVHGFYALTATEAAWEDSGAASVGLDSRSHDDTIEEAAQRICQTHDIDPYEREVFEFWAVSSWLAERLREQGEKVDTDFGNLNVWARTTTGQAIAMDGVIERIWTDLHKEDAR